MDHQSFNATDNPDPVVADFTLRDEANAIVACAFRNGPIEDLHSGKDSELLRNPELSRITNDEMKTIMLNACQTMEKQDDPKPMKAK